MKDLLSKRLADIGKEDVERLIDHQEEEGPLLELKGPLPAPDNRSDPWQQGTDRILPYTRDEVLREVAGMATANGGIVRLGVDETDDEPKRAKAPFLLRDCVPLAGRFEDMAWSCLDPRLPNLEVKGIPLRPDGVGVVLFRVTSSLRGPHGLNTTKRAYIRRGCPGRHG